MKVMEEHGGVLTVLEADPVGQDTVPLQRSVLPFEAPCLIVNGHLQSHLP